MTSLIKNIVVIIGLAGLCGIGYYLFVVNRDATLNSESSDVGAADIETQEILSELAALQSIQISTEIFTDPRFRSLRDFSSVIDQVPVGRSQPFKKPTSGF